MTHPIGRAARLAGVTVKALRHYDAIGLLIPSRVDPVTGYRWYTDPDIERARQITTLRALGLSLAEVAAVLDRDPVDARAALEQVRDRLNASIDRQRAALASIEDRLQGPPEQIRVPELVVASVRDHIDAYADADELLRELLADAPAAARAEGTGHGALWHRCEGDEGGLEVEVFVAVPADAAREPARGRVWVRELPPVTVACASTADARWPEAYARLDRWMAATGNRLAGPKREWSAGGRLTVQYPLA